MSDAKATNARASAARLLDQVVSGRRSLNEVLKIGLQNIADGRERALVQELAYGTLRWYYQLDALLQCLLNKPLKKRDSDLRCLVLSGLYQLARMALPSHVAINETVQAARVLDKAWATGLVNAVLRGYQRRKPQLEADIGDSAAALYAHPGWLIERLVQDWPDDWETILWAGNQRPPLSLRVNQQQTTRPDYLALLQREGIKAAPLAHTLHGIKLEVPVPVDALPGFDTGLVSVQDAAAQLTAGLLELAPGLHVLDACAAPGGKTAHILETEPGLASVTAIDIDERRLRLVEDNLARLGLAARVLHADAAEPASWCDGESYERILLDVPCSATGVIRRHPDIKLLRRPADISSLVSRQAQLLSAMWPLLPAGGMLLYTTCSVLADENERQTARFLEDHPDAVEQKIAVSWGRPCACGRQILPGEDDMDGFYFACMRKQL
ncbi:MAG: 16S rRNA (cytosine(967)-C(5))-methyltransferase RsmB [Gammaproteobacteria bacterium]|nr:16S rRNA (cytosine(967)-C(5))-methyltransferase RsmB [Gammaproteobacteria bacterium]MDH3559500.1 16S rRNA (cytosine(967)-C(5))-methyltransferase RsmB [Gammaproteobacteria bacterium]